jgi:glycosyltransferase involved in cell wall biosynthesis
MPAISVITPAYNVAPYIAHTIESALSQTVSDLELIVIDDGSSDDTFEIASGYARRDPRVRLIQQPNRGISAARNRALRVASGSLIAILDGDDIWLPHYLERQVRILAEHPEIDVVTGNGWFLGGPRDGEPARPWPDRRDPPALKSMLEDETAVFIMSVFHRRVYERVGGFDESLRTNEDYDFWIRAALAGCLFRRNDEPLGYYRRREDSLSAGELRMVRGIIRVLHKAKPALAGRPELSIVETQLARFETERLAAEARASIEAGDFRSAGDHLRALHRQRGGTGLRVAGMMARWAPRLLSIAYSLRRARLASATSTPRVPLS